MIFFTTFMRLIYINKFTRMYKNIFLNNHLYLLLIIKQHFCCCYSLVVLSLADYCENFSKFKLKFLQVIKDEFIGNELTNCDL